MAINIDSDTPIDIDVPFKVTAGPGAGKTHWLSSHICHVMTESKRLGVTRKIACISYTNVGADTIMSRLPEGASSFVEVCTIHSFLYKHVLKPFIHLESDSFGLNIEKLHIEPPKMFLTREFARELLQENGTAWIGPQSLLKALNKCRWEYTSHEFKSFKPEHPQEALNSRGEKTDYNIPNKLYKAYCLKRWSEGYISYDDIIFLSIELLNKRPAILNFIKAKFPYFFVDEFQDTTPPIIDFVRRIGDSGVVVGVVGDKAQTIYNFIGASVELFENFTVPDMIEYEIHGNRRSTLSIINLLNHLRPDFIQEQINKELGDGFPPTLLIGNKLSAYNKSIEICGTADVHTLAYANIVANSMCYEVKGGIDDNKILDEGFIDSDIKRATIVRCLLKATEYAHHNNLKEAWSLLDIIDEDRTRTIGYLRKLLRSRDNYINCPLYKFYQFIKNVLNIYMATIRGRDNKMFYEKYTYKDFAVHLNVADADGIHKTIHKAKGEEYDNVLVVLGKEGVDVLVNPDLENMPAHRVYYVGMSRARKSLFINVENIDDIQMQALKHLPITIERV